MPAPSSLSLLPPGTARRGPMPRQVVDEHGWQENAGALSRGELTLLSLWADSADVHLALLEPRTWRIGIVSLAHHRRGFPSIARLHPPAQRLERTITDLFGLVAEGAEDQRPWLDHGCWPVTHPLGAATKTADPERQAYPFLPAQGDSLHQVPVGPVHAGIIEPGHFRFTAQGETVVRLEARLGYVHKGIDGLMRGATLTDGATLAGRTSGDSTVAYGWAFAQAAEAALGAELPERAIVLRALMAELERLANHLGDIGAICNDAAFAMMLAHCSVLREQVLRTADACFGHRFMRDRIVPGGVAFDLDEQGKAAVRQLLDEIGGKFPALVDLYDNTASLLDRTVQTGVLRADLAHRFGAGGPVGRASGRDFDVRRDLTHAPYDRLVFQVPVRDDGDVNARVWIRIREVEASLALLRQLVEDMPEGSVQAPLPSSHEPREGLGLVESFRGDILVWLALDAQGRIGRCHLRDPSWFQWPLLEAVIEDNIIADFPLCNKSFNCSYAGHDL